MKFVSRNLLKNLKFLKTEIKKTNSEIVNLSLETTPHCSQDIPTHHPLY